MQVKVIKVGLLQTNCYILVKDDECLVIDPGDDFGRIDEEVKKYKLKGVLLTHRHPDHVGALGELVKKYGVVVYDKGYFDEGEYEIGNFKFNVIYTMGHTNDSISYFFPLDNILFTGDFLFKESIGRTDLDGGSVKDMGMSIGKIKRMNDSVLIYPGHGPSTNLGYEKKNNPFLK